MSQFVQECQREWKRLGVPEAASNEMAADLAADLAEAEAEGVSPEEVLGNAIFDARSFAASWATARGLANSPPRLGGAIPRPPWAVVAGLAASLFALAAGFVIAAAGFRHSSSMVAPGGVAGPRHFWMVGPPLPGRLTILDSSALQPLGWILLVVGLVGLGLTVWLWRPWAARGRSPGFDENVRLPSYL